MSEAAALIATLRSRACRIWVEGETLHVAPLEHVDPSVRPTVEERVALARLKPEVVALLRELDPVEDRIRFVPPPSAPRPDAAIVAQPAAGDDKALSGTLTLTEPPGTAWEPILAVPVAILDAVRDALRSEGSMSGSLLAAHLHRRKAEVLRALRALVGLGEALQEGCGRSVLFRLTDPRLELPLTPGNESVPALTDGQTGEGQSRPRRTEWPEMAAFVGLTPKRSDSFDRRM